MPKQGVTVYDLLVSCPNDVNSFLSIIKEVVESFNKVFGETNNIRIEIKHWSSDSFPQGGNRPQKIINSQLVDHCDVLLAIFWSRFGTPTDSFGSGTEEEITRVIMAQKQVFLYFLDKPISPSKFDQVQYEKVINFKKKYEGLFCNINDEEEFRKLFLNHLSLYFLTLFNTSYQKEDLRNLPILKIRGINDNFNTDITVQKRNFANCQLLKDKENYILDLFSKISEMTNLSNSKSEQNVFSNRDYEKVLNLDKLVYDSFEELKLTITNYFSKIGVLFDEDFWDVGSFDPLHFCPLPTKQFTDGDLLLLKKSNSINSLYRNIKKVTLLNEYLQMVEKIPSLNCLISNTGKTFDEDIEVKLIFPKNSIIQKSQIPHPNDYIVEEINEFFMPSLFHQNEIVNVKQFPFPSNHNFFSDGKQEFEHQLAEFFCYKFISDESRDYLLFQIPYLKQNDSIFFPSLLLFHNKPKLFEYEIRSKHFPDVQYGKLIIKT